MMNVKELLLYKLIKMLDDRTLASIYQKYLIEVLGNKDASCEMKDERIHCAIYDDDYNQYGHSVHKSTVCEELMREM